MGLKMKVHESAYIADGAVVLGDVFIGEESSVWFHTTIRADRGEIRIGKGSNIQDNTVVHVLTTFAGAPITKELSGTIIFWVTNAPAPMMQFLPIFAPFKIIAPIPTSVLSSILQP